MRTAWAGTERVRTKSIDHGTRKDLRVLDGFCFIRVDLDGTSSPLGWGRRCARKDTICWPLVLQRLMPFSAESLAAFICLSRYTTSYFLYYLYVKLILKLHLAIPSVLVSIADQATLRPLTFSALLPVWCEDKLTSAVNTASPPITTFGGASCSWIWKHMEPQPQSIPCNDSTLVFLGSLRLALGLEAESPPSSDATILRTHIVQLSGPSAFPEYRIQRLPHPVSGTLNYHTNRRAALSQSRIQAVRPSRKSEHGSSVDRHGLPDDVLR